MGKQEKNFIKRFWSYLMVITIPVILVGIVTVGFFFGKLAADTRLFNEGILDQTQNMLDETMRNMLTVAYQLQNNGDIRNFIQHHDAPPDTFAYYKMRETLNRSNGSSALYSVGIYLPKTGEILDQHSLYTVEEYYYEYLHTSGHDLAWWQSMFQQGIERPFFSAIQLEEGKNWGEGGGILYCQPMDFANKSGGGAYIAILDNAVLLDALRTAGIYEEKSMAVVNRDGTVVLQTERFPWTIAPARLQGGSGEFKSGRDVVFYRASQQAELQYVCVFHGSGLAGNVYHVASLFVLLLAAALVVSALFARFGMRWLQKPVWSVFYENRQLSESLSRQMENASRQLLVNSLLNVQTGEQWMEDAKARYGLGVAGSHLLVAAVGIPGYEKADAADLEGPDEGMWDGVCAQLAHVWQQAGLSWRHLQMPDCLVFVLGYGDELDIEMVLQNGLEACRSQLDLDVSIGAGDEVQDPESIWRSYDGAAPALRYGLMQRPGELVWYRDIKAYENDKVYYTKEKEASLVRNIKTGAKKQVEDLLDELYQVNFYDRRLMQSSLKRLIASMALTVYQVVDDVYAGDRKNFEKYGRVCQNLLQNANVDDGFEILRQACLSLCNDVAKQDGKTQFKQKITRFIEEHYMDSNLSLDMLADFMGVNYYYLSRLFKETMGSNFASYLTAVRMEKAKELLNAKSATVKQVAQQVGFADSNSFIRAYKKFFQTTPGHQNRQK